MSEQVDGHMQAPSSFNFHRESLALYGSDLIRSNKFQEWTNSHMYRSSYAHHHSPVYQPNIQDSLQPRTSHIPGYSGFIPKNRAESMHGKTYSNTTKEALGSPELGLNRSGLATTGFNITKDALVDKSKNASSAKYGKTEIQRSHPAWVVICLLSSQQNGSVPPKKFTLALTRWKITIPGQLPET